LDPKAQSKGLAASGSPYSSSLGLITKKLRLINTVVRLLLFVFILQKLHRSVVFVVDVLDSSRYIYNAYYFSACRILVSSNVGLVINFRRTGWVKCGAHCCEFGTAPKPLIH